MAHLVIAAAREVAPEPEPQLDLVFHAVDHILDALGVRRKVAELWDVPAVIGVIPWELIGAGMRGLRVGDR